MKSRVDGQVWPLMVIGTYYYEDDDNDDDLKKWGGRLNDKGMMMMMMMMIRMVSKLLVFKWSMITMDFDCDD